MCRVRAWVDGRCGHCVSAAGWKTWTLCQCPVDGRCGCHVKTWMDGRRGQRVTEEVWKGVTLRAASSMQYAVLLVFA